MADVPNDPSKIQPGDACPVVDFDQVLYRMRRIHRMTPELLAWLRKCFGGDSGDWMPKPPPELRNGRMLVAIQDQWVELVPERPEWVGKMLVMKDGDWQELVPDGPGVAGKPYVFVDDEFKPLADYIPPTTVSSYEHKQDTPSAQWQIYHGLNTKYPRVLILDAQKRQIIGAIDWASATDTYIRVNFGRAVAGTAIITGG